MQKIDKDHIIYEVFDDGGIAVKRLKYAVLYRVNQNKIAKPS